jgi:hypothetical protein
LGSIHATLRAIRTSILDKGLVTPKKPSLNIAVLRPRTELRPFISQCKKLGGIHSHVAGLARCFAPRTDGDGQERKLTQWVDRCVERTSFSNSTVARLDQSLDRIYLGVHSLDVRIKQAVCPRPRVVGSWFVTHSNCDCTRPGDATKINQIMH